MRAKVRRMLDMSAIGLSFLCLLHCLAFPIVLVALPILEITLENHNLVHWIFFLIAFPLSLLALGIGVPKERRWLWVPASIGLALMLVGAIHDISGEYETHLTLLGATLLAFAHFMNWRYNPLTHRSCD